MTKTNKPKAWQAEYSKTHKEGDTYMRLFNESGNEQSVIMLAMCDKDGNKITGYNVLTIDFDLKAIMLIHELPEDIPLKTDIEGYVLIEKLEDYIQKHIKKSSHQAMVNMMRSMREAEQEHTHTIN